MSQELKVSLAGSILRTTDLKTRSSPLADNLPSDPRAEARAFYTISELALRDPALLPQRVVEFASELCHGAAAGFNLLVSDPQGEARFTWQNVAGEAEFRSGVSSPRTESAAGVAVDAGEVVVIVEPARFFPYLGNAGIHTLPEILVAPVFAGEREPVGALWITPRDGVLFSPDDARLATLFASHLGLALKLERRQEGWRELGRRAEAAERSLARRDLLLREVNHRVKNSFQLAANLLQLQAAKSADRKIREALVDAGDRISVLGRVHQMLYQGATDAQAIDMPKLLRDLADGTFCPPGIRITLAVDQLALNPDHAIPVALIANELLSNALKHAFPHRRRGAVAVSLARVAAGELLLEIADDGIGLPDSLSTESLGLTLIGALSQQCGGDAHFARGAKGRGTVVRVRIVLPA